MSPLGLAIRNSSNIRKPARAFAKRFDLTDPENLSSHSNRTEAQDVIREAIRRGEVRVLPTPGCPNLVRVIPTEPLPGARSRDDRLHF